MKNAYTTTYHILLSLLFCSFFSNSTHTQEYNSQADAWISQSLITKNNELLVSENDLQTIINVFYLSYERSRATLQAQDQAMTILSAVWHGWQNIAQRRRNPSKKIPYPDSVDDLIENYQAFAHALKSHEMISSCYDDFLELVLKDSGLENKLLKKSFEFVRENARTAVTHALLNVKDHIARLNSYLKQHRHMRFDDEQMLDDLETTRGKIFDYIQENLPIMAFNSYVESDRLFIASSEKQWRVLLTTQELSNLIWHAVETARANYYSAYYTHLYTRMVNAGLTPRTLYAADNKYIQPLALSEILD